MYKFYFKNCNVMIFSRANLSDQYFTNRQDRYIVFQDCKHLCDFFDKLVSTVSSMSFLLKPDNSVTLHPGWSIHPSEGKFQNFLKYYEYLLRILQYSLFII